MTCHVRYYMRYGTKECTYNHNEGRNIFGAISKMHKSKIKRLNYCLNPFTNSIYHMLHLPRVNREKNKKISGRS
jgi:hypothetical protein